MSGDDAVAERVKPEPSAEQGERSDAGHRGRRISGIRIFSSAPDAARARRPTDGVLLALAILGAIALSFPAPGPTAIDTAASNLVAQLPGLVGWFWEIAYDLLIIWSAVLVAGGVVRARTEAVVPLRGAGRGDRPGVRDPGEQRQRHQPVDEPQRPHQFHFATDLPGDTRRPRHRRHRDRVTGPRPPLAADRSGVDRDRGALRDRPWGDPSDRGRRRVPDRVRVGRLGPLAFRFPRRTSHPRTSDRSAPRARPGGERGPRRRTPAAGRRPRTRLHVGRSPSPREDLRSRCLGRATGRRLVVGDLASRRQTRRLRPTPAGGARGVRHVARRARRGVRDAGGRGGGGRSGGRPARVGCERTLLPNAHTRRGGRSALA